MPYTGSYYWKLRQTIGSQLLPVAGAGTVIRNSQGHVLLLKRTEDGEWNLPGGIAEPGDTFLSTALRELEEETGLILQESDLKPFACISDPKWANTRFSNGDQIQGFGLCFLAEKVDKLVKESGDENTQMRFFALNALPRPLMSSTGRALQLLRKYLESGTFQVS